MARLDRDYVIIEALKVVKHVLTKENTMVERKNPFRSPTKKELAKHPKLIEKQRRRL
jgi:hypothetical protein